MIQKAEMEGDACEINKQCTVVLEDYSECTSNICVCSSLEFTVPPNFNECLPLVDEIGGSWKAREQCQMGAPGHYSD